LINLAQTPTALELIVVGGGLSLQNFPSRVPESSLPILTSKYSSIQLPGTLKEEKVMEIPLPFSVLIIQSPPQQQDPLILPDLP